MLRASLPCSHQPATGVYSEPDALSHTLPSHSLEFHFNIILPFAVNFEDGQNFLPERCGHSSLNSVLYARLLRPSGFFPSVFPNNILYTSLSAIRATCLAHHILRDFIILYLVKSTDDEISHYAVSSSPLLPRMPKYLPQYPTFKHPKPTVHSKINLSLKFIVE